MIKIWNLEILSRAACPFKILMHVFSVCAYGWCVSVECRVVCRNRLSPDTTWDPWMKRRLLNLGKTSFTWWVFSLSHGDLN